MDRKETDWQDTETLRKIVQSDIYDLGQRLIFVSHWLEEAGLSPEAIMLGYFNECLRVAMGSGGINGSLDMANRLHWHIEELIQNLSKACHSLHLAELPAGPTVTKSDS
jgi:hypothetical protein